MLVSKGAVPSRDCASTRQSSGLEDCIVIAYRLFHKVKYAPQRRTSIQIVSDLNCP